MCTYFKIMVLTQVTFVANTKRLRRTKHVKADVSLSGRMQVLNSMQSENRSFFSSNQSVTKTKRGAIYLIKCK